MAYPPSSGSPYATAPYAPMTPPAPKGIKGPLILLLFGIGLCIAAIAVLIAFATSVGRIVDDMNPIEANGTTTVSLDSAVVYGLYGNGRSQCEVVGPDGAELEVTVPTSTITVNDRLLFGQVAVETSGEHTITCTTAAAGKDVYFGSLVDARTVGRSVFSIFAVVGMFIVGVPMTIAGIIWLAVRISNNAKARRAWATATPTGGGGQGAGYGPGAGHPSAF